MQSHSENSCAVTRRCRFGEAPEVRAGAGEIIALIYESVWEMKEHEDDSSEEEESEEDEEYEEEDSSEEDEDHADERLDRDLQPSRRRRHGCPRLTGFILSLSKDGARSHEGAKNVLEEGLFRDVLTVEGRNRARGDLKIANQTNTLRDVV